MAAVLNLPAKDSLYKRAKDRLGSMKTERQSFEPHYRELQDYFLTRRGRFITDSKEAQGQKRNGKLIDPTPKFCARTLGAGFHSGSTNPATQWFRLTTPDPEMMERPSIALWLYTLENRMRDVLARSNLYAVLPNIYMEAGVFGTAPMLMPEHDEKVIHFIPKTVGSYYVACNADGVIDTMYCEYKYTVRQIVEEYLMDPDERGVIHWDRATDTIKTDWEGGRLQATHDILHVVEPNYEHDPNSPMAKHMPWVSIYFLTSGREDQPPLKHSGFMENPLGCFRWELTEITDSYGSSCGMDALGVAKAVQVQQKDKAKAIKKLIDPPMVGDPALENQASTLVAGECTFAGFNPNGVPRFQPAYVIKPEIEGLLLDINDLRELCRQAMYTDLFFAITRANPRNATVPEIEARREEQILALGPVLQNHEGGIIVPIIDRLFAIMVRASQPVWDGRQQTPINPAAYIPPPPRELQRVRLKVELIGALSQAFKAANGQRIEGFVSYVMSIAEMQAKAGLPITAMDKLDVDQSIDEYALARGVPPTLVRTDDDVDELRDQRAQEQEAAQQQMQAETADKMASAAKQASETRVGTGSALDEVSEAAA